MSRKLLRSVEYHPQLVAFVLLLLLGVLPIVSAGSQWVKYSGNPILSPTPGGWDSDGVYLPRVTYDGTQFRMWYAGSNSTSYDRIGYASSPDGLTWTKYPMPVLLPGNRQPGRTVWDSLEVSLGSVVWNGSAFLMWYSGRSVKDASESVGLAFSSDGVSWTKYQSNPVMTSDSNDLYPYVIRVGNAYKMWYTEGTFPILWIDSAASIDGIHWTKNPEATLEPGAAFGQPGSWDGSAIYSPAVIYNGSAYWMWYTGGSGVTNRATVGYATSKDGISLKSWIEAPDNPIVSQGSAGAWDSYNYVQYPDAVLVNNGVMLYYSAIQRAANGTYISEKIGLAQSPQGFSVAEFPIPAVTLLFVVALLTTTIVTRRFQRNGIAS